jgi:hypothetical protein
LALTLPTSGGRSVGIVRLRTTATEFSYKDSGCVNLKGQNNIVPFGGIFKRCVCMSLKIWQVFMWFSGEGEHGDCREYLCQLKCKPSKRPAWSRQQGSACWSLVWIALRAWKWRWYVPQERRFIFAGLYGDICLRIELFIAIVVKTNNLTQTSQGRLKK